MLEGSIAAPRARGTASRTTLAWVLGSFNLLSIGTASELTIRHDPPACVLAEAFPSLTADVDPPEGAVTMRVAFRPEAATAWHAVAAAPADGRWTALLPRPRLAARTVHYRFEATRGDASVVTGPEYAATVVADAGACPGRVAETVPSATVLVDVPPGAPMVPPVPAGFDPVGAVSSAPHAGSGKKKVGLLAGVVVGGGAVVGAVIAGTQSSAATATMPPPPGWQVVSSTPPSPSEISISRTSFTITVSIIPPRTLGSGTARVGFQAGLGRPPCAVLAGPNPPLMAGVRSTFTLGTPFLSASACGLTSSAHITFLDASGQEIVASGTSDFLDASIMYTFVP